MRKRLISAVLVLLLLIASGCSFSSLRPDSYGEPEQTAEVLVKAINIILDDAPGLTRDETVRNVARFFISDQISSMVMEGVFKLADEMHEAGFRTHMEISGSASVNGSSAEIPVTLYMEKDGSSLSKDFTLKEEKSKAGFWYVTALSLW